jgi:hypothetical protein
MKATPQVRNLSQRHESDPRASRNGRSFPQTDQSYQSATLLGTCGTPAKFRRGASFFRISDEYFAEEAPRGFAVDAGIFTALMFAAVLPIVNSLQAVATLIHSLGVL